MTCQLTPVAAFERWVGKERARGAGSREAVEPSAGRRGRGEAVSGEKFAESGQRRAGRRNGIARSGEKRSAGRWARREAGQRISGERWSLWRWAGTERARGAASREAGSGQPAGRPDW